MGVLDGMDGFISDSCASVIDDVLQAPRLLLVDSGAFLHTCPRDAFPGVVLEPLASQPSAVVADGRALPMHGSKLVNFVTAHGEKIAIRFFVSDVSRSILSVGQLKRDGFAADFVASPTMQVGGHAVPLFERNNLFYLPVRLAGERWTDDVEREFRRTAAPVMPYVNAITRATNSWHFYEYCCDENSVLSTWCRKHNIAATRLGLPEHDMGEMKNV